MSDSEMTWAVDKSVADVWLAVHHAVFEAVPEAVYRTVDGAVYNAVYWAVNWAVNTAVWQEPEHPALQDYLKGLGT